MKIDFNGRTVLVTGASRGIGLQIARDLDRCGADLILTSTVEGDQRLAEAGLGHHQHMVADFSDRDSTSRFVDAVRKMSQLDGCVNNAGLTRHGPFAEATEEQWDMTHEVDLRAPYLVTQAVATVMRRHEYGRVVNIGSIWGHITMMGRSIYTAAKFGLRGMTVSHAVELAADGILVNVVAPGFTRTDMVEKNYSAEDLARLADQVPVGRIGEPADVSNAVLFLLSDLNTFITGQSLVVDGGYTIT